MSNDINRNYAYNPHLVHTTLADEFAGRAMHALAKGKFPSSDPDHTAMKIAETAYLLASHMLARREVIFNPNYKPRVRRKEPAKETAKAQPEGSETR